MYQIIVGTLIVSIMHAVIPSHWLPLLMVARMAKWTRIETTRMTVWIGLAHIFSSILLGVILGFLGYRLNENFGTYFHYIGSGLLILMGLFFIYRHHTHHHFHIDDELMEPPIRKKQVVLSLMMFMILSPCLEIEVLFFTAGKYGWWALSSVALIYGAVTLIGMVSWIQIAWKGIEKFNLHKIEHNAGLITGWTIVFTGLVSLWMN